MKPDDPTPLTPAVAPPSARAVWRLPSFRRFLLARFAGSSGQQMLMVAVGWHMYDLTGSAWDLGLVGLYQFLPSLLLMLVTGHVADRMPRHLILAVSLAMQALLSLSLAMASANDAVTRTMLLILSVALGVVRAFQMPAQQALPAVLVPSLWLARAVALSAATMQVAVIGGPALGGLLYALGAPVVYATCACLGLAGMVWALMIRLNPAASSEQARPRESVWAGVSYIRSNRPVLGAMSLDLLVVLLGGATALLPIFAKDILQVGPAGLGVLRAAPAVGALITSLFLAKHGLQRHVGRWMYASVAIYGVCMLIFGLSGHFFLSLIALMVSGAADMVSVVIRQTLVQLETPDAMRGRVSAVNAIFIGASNQLGEFESGATAAWWGPVGSVVGGGLGSLAVVLLWMRLFPDLYRRDHMDKRIAAQ